MNGSNFYPKRNYEFSRRGRTSNTRKRRDRYFQLNNRCSNFEKHSVWQRKTDWPEFRGVSKPWKACFQNPGVQDARAQAVASSFSAGYRHQPFIPKLPNSLNIPIPNFSGMRPPDLFIFSNPSAETDKSAASPLPSVLPRFSCSPANEDVGASLLKSNKTEINDEVIYLYTVQTKRDGIVEVVDLSDDSERQSFSDKFRASDNLSCNSRSSDVEDSGNSRMIPKIPEKKMVPSSEKQDASLQKGRKRKNSSEDLHCDICESEYEFVRSRGEEIFRARCGHMFCQECFKKLDFYKCPECNLYLQKLFKVFL